ncbi:unnamed protein product [Paramecium primaurelia]|uniref:Uncharacterized protein n=1 Tax=Paramecium primaurelia TaxID=5886 RepID=A0A8S1N1V6_PARPR|nr:unnamed protein product [Paramecium primaurelia]
MIQGTSLLNTLLRINNYMFKPSMAYYHKILMSKSKDSEMCLFLSSQINYSKYHGNINHKILQISMKNKTSCYILLQRCFNLR